MSPARSFLCEGDSFSEEGSFSRLAADRGFRYGMSVFETFALRGGRVLDTEAHLDRLAEAARHLLGHEFLQRDLRPALDRLAEILSFDGVLRLYLTAGEGSPLAEVSAPALLAIAEPATFPTEAEVQAGWNVALERAPFSPQGQGFKTGNYWANIRAMQAARMQNCEEALLFNPEGNIVTCSMGNVFLVVDGVLKTPRLEDGARRGVVREWVLTRTDCQECAIDFGAIYQATECFVTNSRIGVMPVTSLDGRVLPDRVQGLHLNHLRRAVDV